jgi:hypothetical protein
MDGLARVLANFDRDRLPTSLRHVFGIEQKQITGNEFDDASQDAFDQDHVALPVLLA